MKNEVMNQNKDLVKNALALATKKGTMAGLKSGSVLTIIESMRDQIAQALPKHITADRIISLATTYIASNPKIAECTAPSLLGALMQASILGLEPIAALGQVYFVPYGRNINKGGAPDWVQEVQFQIGYKGYIKLAQNSKEIKMISAEVVLKGDTFEFELGLEPKLKHIPNTEGTGEEPLSHAYAVVHYHSGGYNFVVLTKNAIEKLRKRSPSQKKGLSGAWETDYHAMAKAKAIKQLARYMPLATEIQKAFASDEATINEKSFSNNQTGFNIDAMEFQKEDDKDEWVSEFESSDNSEASGEVK